MNVIAHTCDRLLVSSWSLLTRNNAENGGESSPVTLAGLKDVTTREMQWIAKPNR